MVSPGHNGAVEKGSPAREPRPAAGRVLFEEGDFHGLSSGLAGDPQYNDRRLLARRKLLALGKEAAERIATSNGPSLECRTSLHHPSTFNGMRVRRLWAYLTRSKADKRKLKSVLGPELAKDLDSAYRNAYLCLAIEADALEVSFRIHPDAWYDGENLKKRVQRDGVADWRGILNELSGYFLKLHDWKGEWRCGELSTESLEEYLASWTPGEHGLAVERRFPAPPGARGAALEEGAADALLDEVERLVPLYRYAAWSGESDALFGA